MSDLNKRLQLGPQAPKKGESAAEEVEEEKEKAPLSDARKGRARGPVRRAPAKSPAPATELPIGTTETTTLGFSKPTTLWHINPDDGMLGMNFNGDKAPIIPESKDIVVPESEASELSAPSVATNTAGKSLQDAPEVGPSTEQASTPLPSSIKDPHVQETEDQCEDMVVAAEDLSSTPPKPSDESPVVSSANDEPVIDDLPGPTETIKPTGEPTKELSNLAESDNPPATGVKEQLETGLGGKEALTEGDGHNPTAKVQTPSSIEQ
jgi:hypothetical protein